MSEYVKGCLPAASTFQVTALAFHPDGATMASADEDGVVIHWDLREAKRIASAEKHKAAVWSLAFSRGSGEMLASGEPLCHFSPFALLVCVVFT